MAGSVERVLPHDREAERAVLGAILLNPSVMASISVIVDPSDFWFGEYKIIYLAMLNLTARGVEIDHVTLGSELAADGSLTKIGGPMALDNLTEVVTSANAEHYAAIVRERAAMRQVIVKARSLALDGYKGNEPDKVQQSFDALQDAVHALSRTKMPHSLLAMGDSVLEMYDRVAHGYSGVPLPWPTLNAMTSGMWPKTITMFVARPGVGKTQVAILAARHAWMEGNCVLIVSPEMSRGEIAERFFAIHSPVSYSHLVHGTVGEYEMPRLVEAVESCKVKEGLWILDSEDDISPRGIDSAIRACRPNLVAIDSLYDLHIKGERRDKLLVALDWFKKAVKYFDIAGCGFVQLNRAAEVSEKKGGGIRLGTIALADEIGQDSHAVFALEQDRDMKDDRIMRFKPLKLRRGSSASEGVEVRWDFESMQFSELERDEEDVFVDDPVPF